MWAARPISASTPLKLVLLLTFLATRSSHPASPASAVSSFPLCCQSSYSAPLLPPISEISTASEFWLTQTGYKCLNTNSLVSRFRTTPGPPPYSTWRDKFAPDRKHRSSSAGLGKHISSTSLSATNLCQQLCCLNSGNPSEEFQGLCTCKASPYTFQGWEEQPEWSTPPASALRRRAWRNFLSGTTPLSNVSPHPPSGLPWSKCLARLNPHSQRTWVSDGPGTEPAGYSSRFSYRWSCLGTRERKQRGEALWFYCSGFVEFETHL